MDALNFFLSLLAVIIAGGLVYFQYFYGQKPSGYTIPLALLRFLSIFGILLLLVNPEFIQKDFEQIKPKLFLAIDNSQSIAHSASQDLVRSLITKFMSDADLKKRFDMDRYRFGKHLDLDTLLHFDQTQTNIFRTIEDLNAISANKSGGIILITDGNQTFGTDYAYMKSGFPVYPVIIGDTLPYTDLEIKLVNVNAYATLDNNFEVEIFINYTGNTDVETQLFLERNNKIVHTEPLTFSAKKKNHRLVLNLPAEEIGMQLYKAQIKPFEGEKNSINNDYNFGVEIIDEQNKVALIYDMIHPDLGMIKRSIESNRQRNVSLIKADEIINGKNDFSIYVLYQPNLKFKAIIENLDENNKNYFVITGSHTDWRFLNEVQHVYTKEISNLTEAIYPAYQNDFNTFYNEDIGFADLPPLKDQLGQIKFNTAVDVMLSQRIEGVETNEPLLATFRVGSSRRVILFGEGIWKWRINSYDQQGNFDQFDQFFNSFIQYLHLSDRSEAMDLIYSPVYYEDEQVRIKVKYYDSNLNINLNSNLILQFKDSTETIPLFVKNNLYEAEIPVLEQGEYQFEVRDIVAKKKREGSFIVVPYTMEQEETGANIIDLNRLALNTKGQVFYPDQFEKVKNNLLNHSQFRTIEKENVKMISLIDWKWLLGLIVLSLSLEWIIRKYKGMI